MDYWFGRKAPESAPCAWGARAIYGQSNGYTIDLLPDRKSVRGNDAQRAAMYAFLDTYALPRLREEYPRSENDLMMFVVDGWHVEASTHNNSGYLYIGCWPTGAEAPTMPVAPYKAPKKRDPKPRRKTIVMPRRPW